MSASKSPASRRCSALVDGCPRQFDGKSAATDDGSRGVFFLAGFTLTTAVMVTADWGHESSWSVRRNNANGSLVTLQPETFDFTDNQMYTTTFCLADGTYSLGCFDRWADDT